MAALEEVRKLQQQGVPEDQIVGTLQEKGVPYKDISEALAQSKIRAAVEAPAAEETMQTAEPTQRFPAVPTAPNPNQIQTQQETNPQVPPSPPAPSEMQRSILKPPVAEDNLPSQEPTLTQEYKAPPGEYSEYPYEMGGQQGYNYGGQYEYQSVGISPETISEISEQVVAEKISEIRKHIEKAADFRTTMEAKTETIDERLKRIEKIIDTLQSSVLKKVGTYITNVDDIKKELIATQKSFSKLLPEIKKTAHRTTRRKSTRKKKK